MQQQYLSSEENGNYYKSIIDLSLIHISSESPSLSAKYFLFLIIPVPKHLLEISIPKLRTKDVKLAFFDSFSTPKAVSYTHLDVYKRHTCNGSGVVSVTS